MKRILIPKALRKADVFFICQLGESRIKIVKCARNITRKVEFLEVREEEIASSADREALCFNLGRVLKELDFKDHLLIVSLPRSQVTCRYLKIPAKLPAEVEKIANLQASRYLPYQANELVTAYQPILVDKDGYTSISLFIAHRDTVDNYIQIFKKLNVNNFSVFLSSTGLMNLYHAINSQINGPVILVDIDLGQGEVVIVDKGNLFFSRSFKFSPRLPGWENIVVEEINKTRNAYSKEAFYKDPEKIVIFGLAANLQGLSDAVKKQTAIPVEIAAYWQKLSLSQSLLNQFLSLKGSCANLVGLGLKTIPDSLNLLPPEIKIQANNRLKARERLRMAYFLVCILVLFSFGILKNIDNKTRFLDYVNLELNKIENDARSIGELQKRIEFVENSHRRKPSSLDILYELHQIIPSEVVLTNFSYDEGGQIILRGQAPQMNNVFDFVNRIEKSSEFRGFEFKVRYASNKKLSSGNLIDFEIGGSRK
jgi:Tfp pilus assembly PilM family ATPase